MMVNNTGVVTGDDGSYLLVDTTSTEARNRALMAGHVTCREDVARFQSKGTTMRWVTYVSPADGQERAGLLQDGAVLAPDARRRE